MERSLLENEERSTSIPKEEGLCRVTSILLYNVVLSFIQNGLAAVVVPSELSIFEPEKAALFNGILLSVSAFINAGSPLVGYFIDRIGRRPLLMTGAAVVTIGVGLFIVGATFRSFPTYFVALLVTQVRMSNLMYPFFAYQFFLFLLNVATGGDCHYFDSVQHAGCRPVSQIPPQSGQDIGNIWNIWPHWRYAQL